jgi:isoamylase
VPVSTLTAAGVSTIYYGYRAWGPNWPYDAAWTKGSTAGFLSDVDASGNRFNPNKLLLDPYARELSHDPITPENPSGTVYASGPLYRALDSGLVAPKGILAVAGEQRRRHEADAPAQGRRDLRGPRPRPDDERHQRSPPRIAARTAGAGLKAAALAALGVTAVEFLPLQETHNDDNDVSPTSTTATTIGAT